MKPRVSVIMSVYNGEAFLKDAIDSILSQSFADFEFLIVDDCSTDRTLNILSLFSDPRIKIIKNESNLGLPGSLNKAIEVSTGEYIARMDADDISHPQRLQRQLKYMEEHPGVLVLGSKFRIIGSNVIDNNLPISFEQIKVCALAQNPVAHPTAFIRRSVFDTHKLRYDEAFINSQDYDLWVKVMEVGRIENFPEVLLDYRVHDSQTLPARLLRQAEMADRVRSRQLSRFGTLSMDMQMVVFVVTKADLPVDGVFLIKVRELLSEIYEKNRSLKLYDQKLLGGLLRNIWLYQAGRLKPGRTSDVKIFTEGRYPEITGMGVGFKIRFVLRSIFR